MTDLGVQPSNNGTEESDDDGLEWVLTYAGETFRSDQVFAAQACAVAELLGVSDWSAINPAAGPRQLVTWTAVLLASRGKGEVMALVNDLMTKPMGELTASLQVR